MKGFWVKLWKAQEKKTDHLWDLADAMIPFYLHTELFRE